MSWNFREKLRLEANDYYWDRANVCSKSIDVLMSVDPTWAFLKYDSGAADWLTDATGSIGAELYQQRRSDMHVFPGFGTYMYKLNCLPRLPDGSANPFADPNVRMAFSQAIDRKGIVETITRLGEPVARTYVPPGVFAGYQSPAGVGLDVASARRLLAAAGYPVGSVTTATYRIDQNGSTIVIEGENARCHIAFLDPAAPSHDFQVAKGGSERRPLELGLLRVNLRGVQARYLAIAAAHRKDAPAPKMSRGPAVTGNPEAASLIVEGETFRDVIVWQPEGADGSRGRPVSVGKLKTDALLAMVRTDRKGKVIGYVMGDGASLVFSGKVLARADVPFSVSADAKQTVTTGSRRAREGLPPLPVPKAVLAKLQ